MLASLGPTAVSSVIPGPSDLPVRYSMFQSWGVSSSAAATAVIGSGIFSIGSQLVLPSLAGVLIVLADVPLSGFFSVIVTASVALAVIVVAIAVTLGSASRTETVGRWLDGPVRAVRRRLKRPAPDENLGTTLATKRAEAVDHLAGKWLKATMATVATLAAKCALLVMVLRFVGIPEDALGWMAIVAVFGLVAGLTAIPLTPGSAGVAELGFVGMLAAVAGDEWVNQITAGVLLYRLIDLAPDRSGRTRRARHLAPRSPRRRATNRKRGRQLTPRRRACCRGRFARSGPGASQSPSEDHEGWPTGDRNRRSSSCSESLDTQAGDGPADDELLDLLGAFEDVVAHFHRFCE